MINILSKSVKFLSKSLKELVEGNKNIIINFVSLGAVQITNFILPLLIYPYLFKVTGAKSFGSIVYALNVFLYLSAITDYGYNLSAPKDIALLRDSANLSKKVSAIIQTKLLLFVLCSILLIIALTTVNKFHSQINLYLFGLIMLLGNTFLPTWLFQGMEEMKHLTWINLIAKLLSIISVFFIINGSDNYFLSLGLIGSANLLSGLIGTIYAYKQFNLKFIWISFGEIEHELKSGWYYFISCFSSILCGNSTIFILGFFESNVEIANYGIAEKITFSIWQIITVFSQVTFPVVSRLNSESIVQINSFIKNYHYKFILVVCFLCMVLFFSSESIIKIATGGDNNQAATLVKILCIFPIMIAFNVPANQVLVVNDKQKYSAFVLNTLGIINILCCLYVAKAFGVEGAAFLAVFNQFLITICLYLAIKIKIPGRIFWNFNNLVHKN